MIPVSGDLVTAENRPEQGAPVPINTPGLKEITSIHSDISKAA